MYPFTYHRASSVAEAASLLAGSPDAKLVAGGHTLIPTMKQRLASPEVLIDLGAARAELAGIKEEGGCLVIGAMTRHGEVATSDVVARALPCLAQLAKLIGDPAVRHRGTIGGSIANNDPAADYPAACIALGATIVTNTREIAAADFFKGLFETALQTGEIITKVSFPTGIKGAYEKFRNPASRYAIVGVFVARHGAETRVAVTGAGADGVFRSKPIEAALAQGADAKALDSVKLDAAGLNTDIHADAAYRAHLIVVLAKRAVASMH